MKNSLKILAILGLLGIIAFATISLAQDAGDAPAPDAAPAPETTVAGSPKTTCVEGLMPVLEKKREEFGQFINQHFQNKSPNSALVSVAIDRFRQYVQELNAEADKVVIEEKTIAADKALERAACQKKIDEEMFVTKEILGKHISATSYAKKTTKLLDAYKDLNTKLDKLNRDMAQMYGYMETFASKVPCYAEKCN